MVLTLDEWEQQWQQNWSKVGSASYELPVGGTGGEEREFLNHTRAPAKEVELLERIQAEFVKGFKALCKLGPAVTVSGSARFNQNHKNYQLARGRGRIGAGGPCRVDGWGTRHHGGSQSRRA